MYEQLHNFYALDNNNHNVLHCTYCLSVYMGLLWSSKRLINTLSPKEAWAYSRGGPNVKVIQTVRTTAILA